MGAAATKAVGNVYYEARKKAAMYNDRLSSREGSGSPWNFALDPRGL